MITLKHSTSGLIKNIPTGFSWTTLFFGVFVPLLRGDVRWAIISFAIFWVTFGISWIIFPFIYNKIYIKELLSKGFVAADSASIEYLKSKGWIA